jgi:hypothetical protein
VASASCWSIESCAERNSLNQLATATFALVLLRCLHCLHLFALTYLHRVCEDGIETQKPFVTTCTCNHQQQQLPASHHPIRSIGLFQLPHRRHSLPQASTNWLLHRTKKGTPHLQFSSSGGASSHNLDNASLVCFARGHFSHLWSLRAIGPDQTALANCAASLGRIKRGC